MKANPTVCQPVKRTVIEHLTYIIQFDVPLAIRNFVETPTETIEVHVRKYPDKTSEITAIVCRILGGEDIITPPNDDDIESLSSLLNETLDDALTTKYGDPKIAKDEQWEEWFDSLCDYITEVTGITPETW